MNTLENQCFLVKSIWMTNMISEFRQISETERQGKDFLNETKTVEWKHFSIHLWLQITRLAWTILGNVSRQENVKSPLTHVALCPVWGLPFLFHSWNIYLTHIKKSLLYAWHSMVCIHGCLPTLLCYYTLDFGRIDVGVRISWVFYTK